MMWKWTDGDHIKAIILDGDSLDNTYLEYPYQRVAENVNIFKVFKQQSIDNQKNIIIYSDVFELIQNVMNKANCESYSIIAISSNIIFLKEMMQNHIGTILAGSIHEEHLKNIPDFSFVSDEKLNRILNGGHIGNGAEFYALDINVNKKKALIYCRSSVMLNNGFTKNLDLYFGGRYYSKSHHFLKDDALSMVLNELKRKYLKQVDGYFDNAIDVVNRREKIDILTYVPLKPKEIEEGKFDRFQSLELKKAKEKGIYLQEIIKCYKNFTQKGKGYYTRMQNVKDAYEVLEDVENKSVAILDDLYTTGFTIKEIAKMLYEKGAKSVCAILLAVNQPIESTSVQYQNLICSVCGSPVSLRINHSTGELFFGCSSFQNHPNQPIRIPLLEGLKQLKYMNKLEVINVNDLNDEY